MAESDIEQKIKHSKIPVEDETTFDPVPPRSPLGTVGGIVVGIASALWLGPQMIINLFRRRNEDQE